METFDWAIMDDYGIVDRYESEEAAAEVIDEYPEGCQVVYSPEPDPSIFA